MASKTEIEAFLKQDFLINTEFLSSSNEFFSGLEALYVFVS